MSIGFNITNNGIVPYGMEELDQQVKRMQDSAVDEINERKERIYNKLHPVIEEKSDAVQLEFKLEN